MARVEGSETAKSLSDLIEGFWSTSVIGTAVALGITDSLAAGASPYSQVASAAGAAPEYVLRILRALQALGVCRAIAGSSFELTEKGRLLLADEPGSMRGRALFASGILWDLFSDLPTVVRAGRPTQRLPTGREGFNQLESHPGLDAMHGAMVESSIVAVASAAQVHDFGRYSRVLDVGGGYGGALGRLLQQNPGMRGDVLDLPYLLEGAVRHLHVAGVARRATFIAGDFFEAVPKGYDCYLLKYIIHDWDDAQALRILASCAAAAHPAGEIVLLERVLPDQVSESDRGIFEVDIAMMVTGGKERTVGEYRELMRAANISLNEVTPTACGCSVLRAAPSG
jgi:orsellinic acid C2-O-methyltransferase